MEVFPSSFFMCWESRWKANKLGLDTQGRSETNLLALSHKEHVNHGESRRADETLIHKKDDD